MECREILEVINRLCDVSLAYDWDNVGLLVGRSNKEVFRVTVALDADDRAVDEAIANGSDLLVTHHPLIFHPQKTITDETVIGRRLLKLIRHDICLISMHTNFDVAPGCMADLAADRLGLCNRVPLETVGETKEGPFGLGCVGTPKEGSLTIEKLCIQVKNAFGLDRVCLYAPEVPAEVTKIAICPGSGADEIELAMKAGAQAYITGDITYHFGTDSAAAGLSIIDAGHYGIEHIFIEFMQSYLKQQLPQLSVDAVSIRQPIRYI